MEIKTPPASTQSVPSQAARPAAAVGAPVGPKPPTPTFSSPTPPQQKTAGSAPVLRPMQLASPRASILWVILFVAATFAFLLAYFIFSKPNTGPASLIFSKIFPKESGLIKLQAVDLDLNSIFSHPVFSRLKEQSPSPLEIPPLGKPNPFI